MKKIIITILCFTSLSILASEESANSAKECLGEAFAAPIRANGLFPININNYNLIIYNGKATYQFGVNKADASGDIKIASVTLKIENCQLENLKYSQPIENQF